MQFFTENKKAFSFIEIAIVSVAVGILIVGILAGKNLAQSSRLTSARMLTKSAPVNGISDLVLWLDATSDESIDKSQRVDGALVSIWYDINNLYLPKNNLTQATAANQPTYRTNGINFIPALEFDGTGLTAYNTLELHTGGVIIDNDDDRTVIFVFTQDSPAESNSEVMGSSTNDMIDTSSGFSNNRLRLRDVSHGNDLFSTAGSLIHGEPHIVTIIGDSNGTRAWSDGFSIIDSALDSFHWIIKGDATTNRFAVGLGQVEASSRGFTGY
ncbi:MAG: hypothetical protein O3B09_00715, partial [Proteobacteria bacterium]|nr:hypothetical protein [Pseudomonadota bacterium]